MAAPDTVSARMVRGRSVLMDSTRDGGDCDVKEGSELSRRQTPVCGPGASRYVDMGSPIIRHRTHAPSKTACSAEPSSALESAIPASPAPAAAPRRRPIDRTAEVRPCDALGLAFNAAREAGTKSIPSPRPTGISAPSVEMLRSDTPGIASTPRPAPAARKPSEDVTRAPCWSTSLPASGAATPTSNATSRSTVEAPSAE